MDVEEEVGVCSHRGASTNFSDRLSVHGSEPSDMTEVVGHSSNRTEEQRLGGPGLQWESQLLDGC